MSSTRSLAVIMSGLIMAMLLVTACRVTSATADQSIAAQSVVSESAVVGDKQVIRFHNGSWQSFDIVNAVAMFITEHGYGYPVEEIRASTEIANVSLPLGDVDVNMELWQFNHTEWFEENVANGKILDLGPVYEKSTQGWYIPRYLVEGDPERNIQAAAPDLKSVFDLPQYWELFKDPEDPSKGVWVNCIIGWSCQKIMRVKATAYGLDEYFNVLEPGASAGIDAAIAGAYERGEPILSYYWEPTWILGKYDMLQLAEPEYTQECWDAISAATEQDPFDTVDAACAYETYAVNKGVSAGLKERAPAVVEFLDAMFLGTDMVNQLSAYMTENELEADEVAVYYLKNHQEEWSTWVTEEAAAKIESALE